MNDFSLQLLAPDVWKWALALVPALCLAFWAYYRILAPLSAPTRGVLWLLRGLAFFLVIFALWQPTLSFRVPDTGRPRLAVLVDRSGSMALPAGEEGFGDRAAEARGMTRSLDRSLGGDYELQWFGFGDDVTAVGPDTNWVGRGATSIGGALEEILVRSASRPVHGIVLVSDGVNTQGRDPVRVAKGSPVPVFAVPVGSVDPPADLEIRKVQTNPRAFAGEPLPIEVVLSSNGMEGARGTLEILSGGEVVAEESFEVLGDKGLEQVLRFEVRPEQPGWVRYDVRVRIDGDAVPENDVREVAIEVMERKTRVLCVSDAVTWDFGFLRQTFEADTTLGYAYLVRTDGGRYRGSGDKAPDALPTSGQDLEEYAAVVLVSTGSGTLPESFLQSLAGFVARGGGLWILGGPAQAEEWARVPDFQRILPAQVVPRPGGMQPLVPVELTPQGMRHPVTALRENPSQTASLFASLPPLWRAPHALQVRGNGRALLTYRGDDPGRAAFAAGFGDRGKVAWFHGQGLWRWRLTASGADLPPYLFADFAIGTVRWLAEPAIRDRFQLEPGRRVYPNGETTSFTASLWDAALQPIDEAEITVEVQAADSSRAPILLEMDRGPDPGSYEARGPGLEPGTYAYRARAVDGSGSELGRTEGTFWVETMGPEFARVASDRETLRQIAEQSSGQMVEKAGLAQLAERIPEAIRRLGRIREVELWNHWVLFALFVLVLSTEWFLRRRRGLA